jgi:D-glycero-alpha-D-manno-heptose-7-phosphate kinase
VRYTARAPLRIDFGGGWTDVPLYAEAEGGAVLNAAITRYATGAIARPDVGGRLTTLRPSRSSVSYQVDAPPGAGLGTTAAQTVLWATLVKTTVANTSDRREIAEIACQISALLGILGGKQDEYASALGGVNFLTFGPSVGVERLDLGRAFTAQLRSRLVLVYSGQSRLSASIHESVWERYRRGEKPVVDALSALRRLAGEMKDALVARDLEALGELLTENWANQRRLDPSVTNPSLDGIFDIALRSGARGGKACGVGGGGCLLFLTEDGARDRLAEALGARRLKVIDFDFDTYGVHLKKG